MANSTRISHNLYKLMRNFEYYTSIGSISNRWKTYFGQFLAQNFYLSIHVTHGSEFVVTVFAAKLPFMQLSVSKCELNYDIKSLMIALALVDIKTLKDSSSKEEERKYYYESHTGRVCWALLTQHTSLLMPCQRWSVWQKAAKPCQQRSMIWVCTASNFRGQIEEGKFRIL